MGYKFNPLSGEFDIVSKKNIDNGTTAGQMAFWDGTKWTYTETSELFWDDTNKRLGIRTNSPSEQLEITGNFEIPTTTSTVGQIKQNGSTIFHTYGTNNLFMGVSVGNYTTTGDGQNIAIGNTTMTSLTTGKNNTALGYFAGWHIRAGLNNVCLGGGAGANVNDGSNNFAMGSNALNACTVNGDNIAIGTSCMQSSTGYRSVGIGTSANKNSGTGNYNIGIGYQALKGATGNCSSNTVIGYEAGYLLSTGSSNVFLGRDAGYRQTTNSNLLIIDNQQRADAATEASNTILYGTMAATPADQDLRINADVGINITPTALLNLAAGTTTKAPLKFTDGTLLTTPEKGSMEFANDKFYLTCNSVQEVIDRTSDVLLETVTVENTTTETTIFTASMPANSLFAGNVLEVRGYGTITNASASDTITIRVKVAGVTRVTLTNAAVKLTDDDFHFEGDATQRTVGTTGSRAQHFHLVIKDADTVTDSVGTIDTTANMDITITVQWNNAKVGNVLELNQGKVTYKN